MSTLKFETLQLHAGQEADPTTGAYIMHLYQAMHCYAMLSKGQLQSELV